MTQTPSDQDLAYTRAQDRYLDSGGMATTGEEMRDDPLFRELYVEEVERIQNDRLAQERRRQASERRRADAAVVPCPYADQETVVCYFDVLKVNKVGDDNRVYMSNGSDQQVLEVVAGHTRAKTSIICNALGVTLSNCSHHENRVWNVSPMIAGANLQKNDKLELDLLWRGDVSSLGFFNLNASPTVYTISANTHNKQEFLSVKVYPDRAWEGSVNVGFRLEERTKRVRYESTGIVFNRFDDGVSTQFGGKIADILETLARYFGLLFEVKEIGKKVTAGAFDCQIVPPVFTISMNSKWQENTTNLLCGYYYNGRIAFDPLVGIEFTANLGIIAMQAIPYVGTILARMAAKEIEKYVAITFRVTGTLGVDVRFSKNASANAPSPTIGGATGRIAFNLQIRAQFNRDLHFVAINCYASGGARGSVTTTFNGPNIDRSGSFATVEATFDGLSVYVAATGRMGASQNTRQETIGRDYVANRDNPENEYRVSDNAHHLSNEVSDSNTEGQGDAERVYPWIPPKLLGSSRINL